MIEEFDKEVMAKWSEIKNPYYEMRRLEAIKPYIKGKKILDIGCGDGTILSQINSEFKVGLDIVKRNIENFIIGDGCALPFKSQTFDCVICLASLEHVPDPKGCLAEIVRVTVGGGVVIVTIPNAFADSVRNKYKILIKKNEAAKSTHCFITMRVVTDIMEKLGLHIITAKGFMLSPIPLSNKYKRVENLLERILTINRRTLCLNQLIVAKKQN